MCWANESPNIVEEKTINLPRVAVWRDLSSRGLIGPNFFEETVTIQTRWGSTLLSCHCEKFSRSHIQSEMERIKRKCYGVSALISRFNPSRLLPLGNFKEQGVCHKTTNTGGTERSHWTCHQLYSISNNPDGMSLCSKSLLGVYCGRRWRFWICKVL